MSRVSFLILAVYALLSCREPPRTSLAATVPVAATLAFSADLQLRTSLSLPDGYSRQPNKYFNNSVEWRAPERAKHENNSPYIAIHLWASIPYGKKNLCSDDPDDLATAYEEHKDFIARQCSDTVTRYFRVTVPPRVGDQDWWLACSVQFWGAQPSRQDIVDVDAICHSLRWEVLDVSPPQPPIPVCDNKKEGWGLEPMVPATVVLHAKKGPLESTYRVSLKLPKGFQLGRRGSNREEEWHLPEGRNDDDPVIGLSLEDSEFGRHEGCSRFDTTLRKQVINSREFIIGGDEASELMIAQCEKPRPREIDGYSTSSIAWSLRLPESGEETKTGAQDKHWFLLCGVWFHRDCRPSAQEADNAIALCNSIRAQNMAPPATKKEGGVHEQ